MHDEGVNRWIILLLFFGATAQARAGAEQAGMENYLRTCTAAVNALMLDQPTGKRGPEPALDGCQDERLHLEKFRPVEALGGSQIIPRPDLETGVLIVITDSQQHRLQWPANAPPPPSQVQELTSGIFRNLATGPTWVVLMVLSGAAAWLIRRPKPHLILVWLGWLALPFWAGLILVTIGAGMGGADFALPGAGWTLAILGLPLMSLMLALVRKWLLFRTEKYAHSQGLSVLVLALLCLIFTVMASPLSLSAEALWLGYPLLLLWLPGLRLCSRYWKLLTTESSPV
jgi:hypothetical protein